MELFTDASFVDIPDEKYRSTGGYVLFFNESVLTWKSKKLKWICNFTAEAEYLALYFGARETIYFGYVLQEAYHMKVWPITVNVDNKAVQDILKDSAPANLTKHMGTKFYSVQQWVNEGLLKIVPVASRDNVADGFTKVSSTDFQQFVANVVRPRGSVVH